MLKIIKSMLRNAPIKEDAWLTRDRDEEGVKNVQFVSFLQESGFRKNAINRHEKSKRFKKVLTLTILLGALIGIGWIAIESAEALELF